MLRDRWQTSLSSMSTRPFSTIFQVSRFKNVCLLKCHNTPVQVKPRQEVFCVTRGAFIGLVAGW
jgi:hypothetical protein